MLNLKIDEQTVWEISELIVPPVIEYVFPKYQVDHDSYNFAQAKKNKAREVVKLFVEKEIDFAELIRRMM